MLRIVFILATCIVLCKSLVNTRIFHKCDRISMSKNANGWKEGGRVKRQSNNTPEKSFSVRRENLSTSKNDGIRQSRIASALREELTGIITDVDIKAVVYPDENLLRSTCVVDVEVSPDLAFAKVFISVLGNSVERRQVFVWLCENVGQVKYSLAQRLRHMRRIPEIFFKLSDNKATADLVALIEEISPKSSESIEDIDFEEE